MDFCYTTTLPLDLFKQFRAILNHMNFIAIFSHWFITKSLKIPKANFISSAFFSLIDRNIAEIIYIYISRLGHFYVLYHKICFEIFCIGKK